MRRWLLLALVVVFCGAILYVGYSIVNTDSSSRPASYRIVVIRVLDQRRIAYREVVVINGCAPTYEQCRTYAGVVQVLGKDELQGQIICRQRWTDCALTIADVGIVSAPLEDIPDPESWRWDVVWMRLERWFQELTRKRVTASSRPQVPSDTGGIGAWLCAARSLIRWPRPPPAGDGRSLRQEGYSR